MSNPSRFKLSTNLEKRIVVPSLLIIIATVLGCMLAPQTANAYLSSIKTYIFNEFSWMYILSVAFFLVFLVILSVGKLGDIRLGDDDEEPEFSFFSWVAMLFGSLSNVGVTH